MEKRKCGWHFPALVTALLFLFNPNVSIIDVLPDFIAFFILARLVERAADIAPYFEEARESFMKLGWLNLAKLLGAVVIVIVRRGNTSDGDIITLVSVVFAVCECILLIGAANNIFHALFYLGERTSAASLITPFAPDSRGRHFNADSLLSFTHLFTVIKCATYALPTVLLLTQNPDNTTIALNPSAYFMKTMIASAVLATAVGAIWLIRMLRYTFVSVHSGDLSRGLDELCTDAAERTFERKSRIRKISSSLSLFAVASVFSIEITFDNFRGISLVPDFLIGIFLFLGLLRLAKFVSTRFASVAAAVYTLTSLAFFLFDTRFKINYDFQDLLVPGEASLAYNSVELLGMLQIVAFLAMLVLTVIAFRKFILNHTAISPEDAKYSRADKEFHSSLIRKTYAGAALAALAMLSHFANIFVSGDVRILETELYDHSPVTLLIPSIPWFGLVVAATSIAFIAYSFYYINLLKEEVRMKYIIE